MGACEQLALGLARLKGLRGVQETLVELKRLEDDADRVLHDAIAALFRDDRIDPLIVIRWKDIYDGLEQAVDSAEHAANVIANIVGQERLGGMDDLTLYAVVAVALFFDFTNGFHDTANSIATSVSTRAMSPRAAVVSSAILNFLGAFVSFAVAATIANGIVEQGVVTPDVILAGLVGAITWNLVTWYLGLPSSSSHALIGGILGSAVAAAGFDVVKWEGLKDKVLIPSLLAPFLGIVLAAALMIAITWIIRRAHPGKVNRGFRRLQLVSGGFVAFTHGTNDAQKTMGIIMLALISTGHLSADAERPPTWVIVSAALAMALGTYAGGWRIIKTLGHADREARPAAGLRRSDGLRVDPLDDGALRLSRSRRRTPSPAASWVRAPHGGSRPCAGGSPATSSSPG